MTSLVFLERSLPFIKIEREIGLFAELQSDRRSANPTTRRGIGRKTRIRIDNLIVWVAKREDREEEGWLGFRPDDDPLRICVDLASRRQIRAADSLSSGKPTAAQ
jgi:hypothetical protein